MATRLGSAIRLLLATCMTAISVSYAGPVGAPRSSPPRAVAPPPDLEDAVLRRKRSDDPHAWLPLAEVVPLESLPFATPAPLMPGGATDDESAERAKAAGLEAIRNHRSLVAITDLEKARAHRPDDEEILRGLARSYFSLGNASRAIDDYRRLLEVAPDDREALYFISLSLLNRRMPGSAMTALLRLDAEVSAAPRAGLPGGSPGASTAVERAVVPVLLAAALRQTGHDRAALEAMRRALDLSLVMAAEVPAEGLAPQPAPASRSDVERVMQRQFADFVDEASESWIALGDGHARLGEWSAALAAYDEASRRDESQLDAVRARRAFVHLHLGQPRDALSGWLESLPADHAIGARELREATWLAEATGDTTALALELRRRGELEARPGLLRLATTLLPPAEAAALRLELLRTLPGDALLARDVILGETSVAFVQGRPDDAPEAFERAARRALSLVDEGLISPDVAATLLMEVPARPLVMRRTLETTNGLTSAQSSASSRANAAALVTSLFIRLGDPGAAWGHALAARQNESLTSHRETLVRAQLAAATALEEQSLVQDALGWSDAAPAPAGGLIANDITAGVVEPSLTGAAAAALIRVRESAATEELIAKALPAIDPGALPAAALEDQLARERAEQASAWLEIAEAWLDLADSRADSSVRSALAGRPGLLRSSDPTAALANARAAAERVLLSEPDHPEATRILIEAVGVEVHAGSAASLQRVAGLEQLRERFRGRPQWSAVAEDCAAVADAAAGRWNDACRRMSRLVEERPHDRRLLGRLTTQWPRRGSPDDAYDWFRRRVESMPSNARCVEGYVASMIARGDTVDALEWLEDRVAHDLEDQVAAALLEALEWSAGRAGSAAGRAEARLRKRPSAPMRELSLAQLALQRGRPDECLSLLRALDGSFPHPRVSRREWGAAIDLLARLEPGPDESGELLLQLVDRLQSGTAAGGAVPAPGARSDLRPETLIAAVRAEVALGSDRAAIDRRIAALARLVGGTMPSAEEASIWLDLAQSLVDAHRPEVAGDALRQRLLAEPRLERGDWRRIADAAATADIATRDPARTRALLRDVLPQRAETGWPELPDLPAEGNVESEALVLLSGRWTLLLETDGAIELLRAALELDPQHGMALNNLGYALLERDGPTDEVASMIERAALRVPASASVIDSLAWLRFRQGRLVDEPAAATAGTTADTPSGASGPTPANRGAATLIKEALALAGNDLSPELLDHAGDVAWRVGDRDEALVAWRRAIALVDSDFPRASTVTALEQHQRQELGLVIAESREIWDELYGRARDRARRKIEQVEQGLDPL